MGSSKYPQEDAFAKIEQKYDGSSNAFTSCQDTNFYFSIANKGLKEMLEVWSMFFIDPLINQDSLEREISAINSEYKNSITKLPYRFYNLLR